MHPAVILLWYVWLETLLAGPLDLPQLTSERRATLRTANRLVPLAHTCRQRAQRAGLIDAALLFGARYEFERLLAVDREELGADRDELVDPTMRWSHCRGGPGESAILAFGVESAWWLHPHWFRRHRLASGSPAAAAMYSAAAECRRWRSR